MIEMVTKKIERLLSRTTIHLHTIVRLLAVTSVLWMVGVPHGVHASQSWDGPALKQVGGAPNIQAHSVPVSVSGAQGTSVASGTSGGASYGAAGTAATNSTTGSAVSTTRITTPGIQGGSETGTVADLHTTTVKAPTTGGIGTSTAKTTTGTGGTAQQAPKNAAPTSPALTLPTYAPVGSAAGQSLDGPAIAGLVFKFLVVLALLFIVLRVLKAIMPGGHGKRAGRDRPLLLHSESIGDKQRILLLDLGGKLVAAGVAGTTMTTLATIEDAEAVDTIRARYAPLADAVPGYQEGKTPTPPSQSFMETLKRAGIVGQRQAGSWSNSPMGPTAPTLAESRREPGVGARNGRRIIRGGESRTRPDDQAPVEPILHEALEAMRAVRRRVEGA